MKPDDLDAGIGRLRAQLGASLARDVGDTRRERKRRDLDAVVSALLQEPAHVGRTSSFLDSSLHMAKRIRNSTSVASG